MMEVVTPPLVVDAAARSPSQVRHGRSSRERASARDCIGSVIDEPMLAALSLALGAHAVPGVSPAEPALLDRAPDVSAGLFAAFRDRIDAGGDPLGDAVSTGSPSDRK